MNEKMLAGLAEGEHLLWDGRPESFETLDKTYKPAFLRQLVITAVAAVAIIAVYCISVLSGGGKVSDALVIILLIIAAYIICRPLLAARKLRKKVAYGATERRLLLQFDDSVTSVPYSALDCCAFLTDDDGRTSFLGGRNGVKKKAARVRAVASAAPILQEGEKCECLAMYALPDAELFREAIAPYLEGKL